MHFSLPTKFHFLPATDFYSLFLNEDVHPEKIVLIGCIIDFYDRQVSLRLGLISFVLNGAGVNACKVMEAFFILSGQNLKKTIICSCGAGRTAWSSPVEWLSK